MGPLALAVALVPSSSSYILLRYCQHRIVLRPLTPSLLLPQFPGFLRNPFIYSPVLSMDFVSTPLLPQSEGLLRATFRGGGVADSGVSESDDEEDARFDGNLLLDAKLQLKLEHKMKTKMKLGKHVRLRRKKLFHMRRMRKKVRCPPSKTNKLKNV